MLVAPIFDVILTLKSNHRTLFKCHPNYENPEKLHIPELCHYPELEVHRFNSWILRKTVVLGTPVLATISATDNPCSRNLASSVKLSFGRIHWAGKSRMTTSGSTNVLLPPPHFRSPSHNSLQSMIIEQWPNK